jgi:Tol biopolymer transport system component
MRSLLAPSVALAGLLLLLPAGAVQVTYERVSGAPGGFINTHSLSGNGQRLIFTSTVNHTGQNADGNLELFVYTGGQIHQLTQTASQPNFMDNRDAQTNYDGTRVVFRSRFALHSNGAQLTGRDLFLARITYGGAGAAPAVTFQRLTTSSEQGPFALSGNGGAVILATTSSLGGSNTTGKLQLVRITLDPSVTFTRLTSEPTGLAEQQWELAVTTSYDGQQVAFHSDLDLDANNNPQGARQIYRIMPNGGVGQLTDVPAGLRASEPAITDDGAIFFTANANLTGANPDGNTELFRIANTGAGVTQLTATTASDDGFGGSTDDVDISPDGSTIVFASRADLVPPANADGNREIFLARYTVGSPPVFEQLTNTANPHPGTRVENVFPRTSNTGDKVAFNSDLDLGVPGTGILYVATVTAPSPASPPVIASFTPLGGGPAVPVTIQGDHLAAATQVRFGLISAPGFQVLSNSRLVATVPAGIVDGRISVTTPHGAATSAGTFRAATFVSFGEEFNQGLPAYPGVAGKDALVRVFSGTSVGGWMVSSAQLQVRMPSGAVVAMPPSMFSPILTNTVQEFSERSNVNFYVPGTVLSEAGSYDFTASITTEGQVVHNRTITATLAPTKDVVLVFQSLMRHPDADEWRVILATFDEFSRIHPIRAGVGDLVGAIGADEPNAGFRVAYLNAPVFAESDGQDQIACVAVPSCWQAMLLELEERLAIVNSGGFEATEFSALFLPRDRLLRGNGQVLDCDDFVTFGAAGFGRHPGTASFTQLCGAVAGTFAHEVAHNMGVTFDGSANSDGSGHSTTRGWAERAFNLPNRLDIPNPIPLMFPFASTSDHAMFLEHAVNGQPVDYPMLVDERRLGGTTTAIDARRSSGDRAHETAYTAVQVPQPRFVLAADVEERAARARVRLAFTAPPGTTVSPVDSTSPYSVSFLAGRRVLRRDRVGAVPMRAPESPRGEKLGDVLNVMRPLPRGTTSVELRRGDSLLARVRPGATAPVVTVRPLQLTHGPGGLSLLMRWAGTDADGDSLRYFVELSRDGRRWVPLSGAMRDARLFVPISGLPGGAGVRVRVTATDGLHVGRAVTAAIQLPAHPPVAAIVRPGRGLAAPRFVQRDTIHVKGLAYDLEEGMLQGGAAAARFRWTVDGRPAGTGVSARLSRLKPGRHRVVLTVADASGAVGADTLHFDVLRDSDGDGIADVDEARVPDLDPGNLYDGGLAPDPRLGTWRDRLRVASRPRVGPVPR